MKHMAKLRLFLTLSNGQGFRRGAAALEIELNARRNRMLYPTFDGSGLYVLPETLITVGEARDLMRRVAGLVAQITPLL